MFKGVLERVSTGSHLTNYATQVSKMTLTLTQENDIFMQSRQDSIAIGGGGGGSTP